MLKNILSLLLSKFYSKQESEAVGHQAMPSTQNVALTPTTTSIDGWGAVYNGVAPTDGFACIRFTADTATCIASAQTQNVNVFTTPQVVGDILLCACPIAKGQVFTLCARQAKNIECWFTKTIGGGYQALKNALLQGGVLCRLKHLYSSLRRSSLSVKRNGSDIRLFRITVLALTLRSNRTLHLQTDGLAFVRPLLNLIVLLTQRAELLHGFLVMRSYLLRQQQHCLFLRVKHLPSTSQAEYQKFGSHQLTVPQLNFALGGASC